MKQLIRKGYTLRREVPENFSEQDRRHFDADLEVHIKENHIVSFHNGSIVQLLLISKWKIRQEYCLTRKISLKKILKGFIKYSFFPKRKILAGLWVLDQWSLSYFHWLTEVLPRLISADVVGNGCSVLLPKHSEKIGFISDSLEIFNRQAISYKLNERLIVSELFAPSHLAPAQFDPGQMQEVRSRFVQFDKNIFDFKAFRKVYISRSKAKRRFIINEEDVQRVLHDNGFVTVFMEEMSFFEQRKLMSETSVLISNHGAGLTNMLFMPQHGKVIELKADADDINNCFFNLARALGHQYFYSINTGDNTGVQKSNITVDLLTLELLLKLVK